MTYSLTIPDCYKSLIEESWWQYCWFFFTNNSENPGLIVYVFYNGDEDVEPMIIFEFFSSNLAKKNKLNNLTNSDRVIISDQIKNLI